MAMGGDELNFGDRWTTHVKPNFISPILVLFFLMIFLDMGVPSEGLK